MTGDTTGLPPGWTVEVHRAIADIAASEWNSCAATDVPYVQHRHLRILEDSGIATPEAGFAPHHVVLRDAGGAIVAAAPAYLKMHSRGELGIDLGLPLAHARSVGPYYPKLQIEVPMTPLTGPRLLVRPDQDIAGARAALLSALQSEAQACGASSVQISYMLDDEREAAELAGLIASDSNAYVWQPQGITSMAAHLSRMHGRRRNMIARERREANGYGLTWRRLAGVDLGPDWPDRFFALYKGTFLRHNNELWLNAKYFSMLFRDMGDAFELLTAFDGSVCVGALFVVKNARSLYAQHWGQSGDHRFLHFELAIYQGVERAIELGVERLDFGATGRHKAPRGIGLEANHHAAWFCAPAFRDVAERGLARKRAASLAERANETARLPFAVPKVPVA